MTERAPTAEYGGLIPCRIAALGAARDPEPRLPGLQNAVYRLIVWLSQPRTPAERSSGEQQLAARPADA